MRKTSGLLYSFCTGDKTFKPYTWRGRYRLLHHTTTTMPRHDFACSLSARRAHGKERTRDEKHVPPRGLFTGKLLHLQDINPACIQKPISRSAKRSSKSMPPPASSAGGFTRTCYACKRDNAWIHKSFYIGVCALSASDSRNTTKNLLRLHKRQSLIHKSFYIGVCVLSASDSCNTAQRRQEEAKGMPTIVSLVYKTWKNKRCTCKR